jgi:hypothetical protein
MRPNLALAGLIIACSSNVGMPDSGPGSDGGFVQAALPPVPVVRNKGGPVIAHPMLVPVTVLGDPLQAQIDDYIASVQTTTYWGDVVSEYGAAAPTALAPVHVPQGMTMTVMDNDTNLSALKLYLMGQLDGAHAAWPVPTPDTLYVLFLPPGTSTRYCLGDAGTCIAPDGYHDSLQLPDGGSVPYAVIARATRTFSWGITLSGIDWVTGAASHEIVEAITDPLPRTLPAFTGTDRDHLAWSLATGGEVGDMCQYVGEMFIKPPDSAYMVQRMWSNASAAAGHDPCIPRREPYFVAAPVLTDDVNVSLGGGATLLPTKGVLIPVGTSKTIELELSGDAETGPWTLSAQEIHTPMPAHLAFTFDRSTGLNGDKVHLTIQSLSIDSNWGGELFWVAASSATRHNVWMGFVGH